MYPIISILISVIGTLLFVFAEKFIRANKPLLICIKVFGGILAVLGLLMLYMLLSGKITLPLSAN